MYLLTLEENNDKKNQIYAESLYDLDEYIKNLNFYNNPVNASLYAYEINMSCVDLLNIKNNLDKLNIKLNYILSNSRDLIISAKSLKINSVLSSERIKQFNFPFATRENDENMTHVGVVRSGDKISSNGNLIIIGDVNPGAQISAKKNIYVWGKLCGVAFAGKNGEDNSTIASLYLNALQLRINKIIAIGPKEKPISNYPEIAIIESGKIIIKPLIINNRN
tara:strand:- start:238 stop:900 length:663 start_codon:yes stop_codon:yes gene_type:complete